MECFFFSFLFRDLLTQLIEKDLLQPTKGVSFARHLLNWFWQYQQYKFLKENLLESEAMIVQDFAENRKASYAVEVNFMSVQSFHQLCGFTFLLQCLYFQYI